MQIYIFKASKTILHQPTEIEQILQHIASGTQVADLVVAVYFNNSRQWTGGAALVKQWVTPQKFISHRGRWQLTARYPQPKNLPAKFKLIRLLLPSNINNFPKSETDIYHWQHTFNSWQDHLAHLFAHELHHFRRYHLNLHPREGEHSANRWALQHVQKLGYNVTSTRLAYKPVKRKSKAKAITLGMVYNPNDFVNTAFAGLPLQRLLLSLSVKAQKKYIAEKLEHFEFLRQLAPGSPIHITFDPKNNYTHQIATIIRVMNKNSVRMVIRTTDGKEWRWPLAWLST